MPAGWLQRRIEGTVLMARPAASKATRDGARILALALLALLLAWIVPACTNDLGDSVEGKRCNAAGECLPGYVCNASKLCVRAGTETNPEAGAGSGVDPVCREGETVCRGACVVLSDDENNCRSCGTTCSAPPHGSPVCLDSQCSFACQGGFLPCGTSCVDSATDLMNCGACGHECPRAAGG